MLAKECHADCETRSAVELPDVGAHVYAMHPTTDVWCLTYAFDDGPKLRWLMGDPVPADLRAHIEAGGAMTAHNAQFERLIFQYILGPRYGFPVPALEQWDCTMARAYAMALPGSLEEAAPAAGIDAKKDMAGRRLMLQMARPRKVIPCAACKGRGNDGTHECLVCEGTGATYIWWDDEDRKQRLYAYCDQDVEVERALGKRVLQLRPQERQIWLLDQKINDLGVFIDVALCNQALKIVDTTQKLLNAEMKALTGGVVDSTSAVTALVAWLKSQGVNAESVAAESIEEMLGGWKMTPTARRALELRQEGAKTSTAKIKKMLVRLCPDGRMRGNLQYHGAGTGRWAARGAQLQNLPRQKLKDILEAIDHILAGASPVLLNIMYAPPLTVISEAVRGMISAPPGKDILSVDFSAIEARVIAWLAGQLNVVAAFAAGIDVYCKQASGIYRREITKKDDQERQVGKVSILSLGYQGGAEAFAKMAGKYGIDATELYPSVWGSATPEIRQKALDGYEDRGGASKLSREAWLAAECIKLAWREENPKIVQYWYDLEAAAISAVQNPGEAFDVGHVSYKVAGSFLWCRLPSGRAICYPYPRLKQTKWVILPNTMKTTKTWEEIKAWDAVKEGGELQVLEDRSKPQIRYKAVHQLTKKWTDKAFYGGLAAENITQGVARDIMAEAMLRVDKAGYHPVLTVHDEIVAEADESFGDLEDFRKLMMFPPAWADGCPIAAEGWRGKRYRK